LFVQASTALQDLPLWAQKLHETHDDGKHLFVHAGIRPKVPLAQQAE
jgi:hypothetical protein